MNLGNLDLDKVEWSASLLPLVVVRILEIDCHCWKLINYRSKHSRDFCFFYREIFVLGEGPKSVRLLLNGAMRYSQASALLPPKHRVHTGRT
jgi:hypothetical protein